MDREPHDDRAQKQLQNWLLQLLRFAVTHDEVDGAIALELATQLDAAGTLLITASFSYFQRTTIAIFDAIRSNTTDRSSVLLLRHAASIENRRLRRAFISAVGLRDQGEISGVQKQGKRDKSAALWRGLR